MQGCGPRCQSRPGWAPPDLAAREDHTRSVLTAIMVTHIVVQYVDDRQAGRRDLPLLWGESPRLLALAHCRCALQAALATCPGSPGGAVPGAGEVVDSTLDL